MRKETRFYLYPGDGLRVCDTLLREAAARGERLCSVEKDYVLGTGITFRMFFTNGGRAPAIRVVLVWGSLKEANDRAFEGQQVRAVVSAKCLWIPLGYYYFLEDPIANELA